MIKSNDVTAFAKLLDVLSNPAQVRRELEVVQAAIAELEQRQVALVEEGAALRSREGILIDRERRAADILDREKTNQDRLDRDKADLVRREGVLATARQRFDEQVRKREVAWDALAQREALIEEQRVSLAAHEEALDARDRQIDARAETLVAGEKRLANREKQLRQALGG